jgi:hypothetical protein
MRTVTQPFPIIRDPSGKSEELLDDFSGNLRAIFRSRHCNERLKLDAMIASTCKGREAALRLDFWVGWFRECCPLK